MQKKEGNVFNTSFFLLDLRLNDLPKKIFPAKLARQGNK